MAMSAGHSYGFINSSSSRGIITQLAVVA